MNFGSSALHIVVEPATDSCRYIGVEDTIEQLSMVHIVECSCQIEREEHCSVSRLFCVKLAAMSAVIVGVVVVGSPHQSPGCGVSWFRLTHHMAIPL